MHTLHTQTLENTLAQKVRIKFTEKIAQQSGTGYAKYIASLLTCGQLLYSCSSPFPCLFFSKSSVSLSFYAFCSSFKHPIVSFIQSQESPQLFHNKFDLSCWTKDNLVSLLISWKVQAELPQGFGWFLQWSINQGPRSPSLWFHLSCVPYVPGCLIYSFSCISS